MKWPHEMGKKPKYVFSRRTEIIIKSIFFTFLSLVFLFIIGIYVIFKLTCSEEIFKTVSWPNSHFIVSAECFACNVTTLPIYTLYLTDKRDPHKRRTAIFSGDRIQNLYACFNGKDLVLSCDIDSDYDTTPGHRNKWRHGFGKTEEEKTLKMSLKEGAPPGKPYKCVLIVY